MLKAIFIRLLRVCWILNAIVSYYFATEEIYNSYYGVEYVKELIILSFLIFLMIGIGLIALQYILINSLNPLKLLEKQV